MGLWLFLASLMLTMAVAGGLRLAFPGEVPSWAYRGSVLVSAGLTSLMWYWPLAGGVTAYSMLLAPAGAFVGGVVGTTSAIGFVEDNAPPSKGVREKILAYHAFGCLEYPAQPRLKRTLDIAVAATGLIITFPLWILISCLIWFDEPGPILFTKNSVGKGGITFRQVKFRSMRYAAERLTGPIPSRASDPRTLRIGAWLRRWHFDEMPELVNVLNGTMSLVGPRPLRAVLVQKYLEDVPGFVDRHTVRPGIACIAQIHKYHISPAERLRKDRVYIRRMSVGLDLRLLWRAVATTVRGARHET